MKVQINEVCYQFYLIPYIKVTYSRVLNGDYELIIGWLKFELSFCF